MDVGHKLSVHKSFRRRPAHRLKVLCSFNLCPVYRGVWKHNPINRNSFFLFLRNRQQPKAPLNVFSRFLNTPQSKTSFKKIFHFSYLFLGLLLFFKNIVSNSNSAIFHADQKQVTLSSFAIPSLPGMISLCSFPILSDI